MLNKIPEKQTPKLVKERRAEITAKEQRRQDRQLNRREVSFGKRILALSAGTLLLLGAKQHVENNYDNPFDLDNSKVEQIKNMSPEEREEAGVGVYLNEPGVNLEGAAKNVLALEGITEPTEDQLQDMLKEIKDQAGDPDVLSVGEPIAYVIPDNSNQFGEVSGMPSVNNAQSIGSGSVPERTQEP